MNQTEIRDRLEEALRAEHEENPDWTFSVLSYSTSFGNCTFFVRTKRVSDAEEEIEHGFYIDYCPSARRFEIFMGNNRGAAVSVTDPGDIEWSCCRKDFIRIRGRDT